MAATAERSVSPEQLSSASGVPSSVVTSAKAAFDARALGSRVAGLVSDSLDDPDACPGTRRLVFSDGGLRLLVDVVRPLGGPDLRIDVDVVPAPELQLAVLAHPAEATVIANVTADVPGRWQGVRVPPGPTSLCVTTAGRHVHTGWVLL